MNSQAALQIAGYEIHADAPPFIIAEAGVHHHNSLELARHYIVQARLAGVHAIKFQTYKASKLAAIWAPTYWDDKSGRTQYDIFAERDKMSANDYAALFDLARELGILLLSTPFDIASADLLHDLGMAAFKIASADLLHWPMLRHIAGYGKPMLLSTGAATLDEVAATVEMLSAYDVPLALLHCTLTYPTPLQDANLRRIAALQARFPHVAIGYSDHTQPQDSEVTCPLAVGLGARIIEKHYTLNKALPEDDHYHAVDQAGLIRLIQSCQQAFTMTRSYSELSGSEAAARQHARRSIVAARPLPAGTTLQETDLDYKRPGTGISPSEAERVLGRRLLRDLEYDALITEADLE